MKEKEKEEGKGSESDQPIGGGYLDVYFEFDPKNDRKVVGLSEKGMLLFKNRNKYEAKVPGIIERIWPLYDRDGHGYLDETEIGDFIQCFY